MNAPRRVILASHLIWTGYGHWLPNDPRGSGSESLRKDELKPLGEIHTGRKKAQPPREEIKAFYRNAEEILEHESLWFNPATRHEIGNAMGATAANRGYTLWALAICSNHAHAVVRTHRDRSEMIWINLAIGVRDALVTSQLLPSNHPLWATRPYKVFLHTPEDVRGRIQYVKQNPMKERLAPQHWPFVIPFTQ